jgi:hypothetical protein
MAGEEAFDETLVLLRSHQSSSAKNEKDFRLLPTHSCEHYFAKKATDVAPIRSESRIKTWYFFYVTCT